LTVRTARFVLVKAALVTVRSLPKWRSGSHHRMMRRDRKITNAAMARRLAIRSYWMMSVTARFWGRLPVPIE